MLTRPLTAIASALPSALKYRLTKARGAYTRLMAWGEPSLTVETIHGQRFQWRTDALTSQLHIRGTYERYMQQAFHDHVKPWMTVYDIGANTGFHSLLLASYGTKVFSFEPNPLCLPSLRAQCNANPSLNITVMPYGLSDQSGTAMLKPELNSMARLCDEGTTPVEIRTIDSLDLPDPDLIKIDVEGHELKALQGGVETIKRSHPVIICDPNDDSTYPDLRELLTPLGYTVDNGPCIVASI